MSITTPALTNICVDDARLMLLGLTAHPIRRDAAIILVTQNAVRDVSCAPSRDGCLLDIPAVMALNTNVLPLLLLKWYNPKCAVAPMMNRARKAELTGTSGTIAGSSPQLCDWGSPRLLRGCDVR